MANDPLRFAAGRTRDTESYKFASNVIAVEPATGSTSLYALVPGKVRPRGRGPVVGPEANLQRSTITFTDVADAPAPASSQASKVYNQDPNPPRNDVLTDPRYDTTSYQVLEPPSEPGYQRDDGLFNSHRITYSNKTNPVRKISSTDANYTGPIHPHEQDSRSAHWPAAGVSIDGNSPMHVYYKSTEDHMNYGHGLPIETRKVGKIGAHPDQPSRDDGTAQLLMAKSLIAKGASEAPGQMLPKAGIKTGQINYSPQHVRFASHWGVDHDQGDHNQETTSGSNSKWITENVRDTSVNSCDHAHSGPAPVTTGLSSMPTAGMMVGGNEPQYIRYSSTMDPVNHGQGDHMQRDDTSSQSVFGYQHDPALAPVVPHSPGAYYKPHPTLEEQSVESKEAVARRRALESQSSFSISHGHDTRDITKQSSYTRSHAGSTMNNNPNVCIPPSTSSARRAEDFKPHASAAIPGSGFRY